MVRPCLVVTSVRWVVVFVHFVRKSAVRRCTHHEVSVICSAAGLLLIAVEGWSLASHHRWPLIAQAYVVFLCCCGKRATLSIMVHQLPPSSTSVTLPSRSEVRLDALTV